MFSSMKARALIILSLGVTMIGSSAEPPEFKWREVEIDKIEIGYGLQLADGQWGQENRHYPGR